MKSEMKRYLVGTFVILVPLLFLEIMLRTFLPFPIDGLLTYGVFDDVIFFHNPNSKGLERSEVNEFKEVVLQYNSRGFRGTWSTLPENKEINVMLGDSFIESRQVDIDKTATEILNQKLKAKFFINAGCSRFTTTTEYLLLKYRLLKLKPKNVYMFFAFNDYADNASQDSGGYFTQKNIFESLPEKRFQPPIFKDFFTNFSQHIASYSAIFAYAKEGIGPKNKLARRTPMKFEQMKFYNTLAAINKKTSKMDDKEKMILEYTHHGLSEIKKLTDSAGIGLKVFIIPLPTQLNQNEWKQGKTYYFDYGDDFTDPSHVYQNRLLAFCKGAGISCVDLYPYFKQATKSGKVFYDFDAHWTEFGQKTVADAVLKNIK